jgi:lycopene beta-cyclase
VAEHLVDVALLGGGGAGLTLMLAIERAARARGLPVPSMAVIDPVERSGADRTWCWWERTGDPAMGLSGLVHRRWSQLELFSPEAEQLTVDLGELSYVMLRSQDLYDQARRAVQRLGVLRLQAPGEPETPDHPDTSPGAGERVTIRAGDDRVHARWVYDSRPAPPQRGPRTSLLQHFRGWTVRFPGPVLDPELPTLMDFRVPQPGRVVAFGYCLPLAADLGLVEYTEFGPRRLTSAAYDDALRDYLRQRWDVVPAPAGEPGTRPEPGTVVIEAVEDGVIPMTDAGYDVRAGPRTFRIGTVGGATRGSTGYTLAAAQRQAARIADLLLAGREPVPPPPYPARHRWMDAVLLRAIHRGHVDGAGLLAELFAAVSPGVLVRFLDGRSSLADDLAVMRAAPALAMIRSGGEDAVARGLARVIPLAGAAGGRSVSRIRSVVDRYF